MSQKLESIVIKCTRQSVKQSDINDFYLQTQSNVCEMNGGEKSLSIGIHSYKNSPFNVRKILIILL